MIKSAWSTATDNLWNSGNLVSFASLVESEAKTKLDQDFEAKRNAKWKMDGFKIEPKLRPKEPIKDDNSPCQKTIEHVRAIKERWKLQGGLQIEGRDTQVKPLTDTERCERFNSRAKCKLTKLDYVLSR